MTTALAKPMDIPLWMIAEHIRGRRPLRRSDDLEIVPSKGRREAAWSPRMNLYGDDEALILTIDLPGVPPEAVEVKVADGMVTVTGIRPRSLLHRGLDIYLQEAPRGLFSRSLRLPVRVDAESMIVTTADGLLTVILPLASSKTAATDGGGSARAVARERWGW